MLQTNTEITFLKLLNSLSARACWLPLFLLKASIYGKEKPKLESDRSQNKKRKEYQNKYGKTNELRLKTDSVAPSLLRNKLFFKTTWVSKIGGQFGQRKLVLS